AFQEAVETLVRHELWIDQITPLSNWAYIEGELGRHDDMIARYEQCVDARERGLGQLAEREHRDLFKNEAGRAYETLIAHYGRLAQSGDEAAGRRILGLLESQRQVEALSSLSEIPESPPAWEKAFARLTQSGPLADPGAALVWTHAFNGGVVFVTLH